MIFRRHAADILPLVPAAAIPLIFLHVMYQPQFSVGPVTAYASDLAVLLVVLAAVASGFLFGWTRLAHGVLVWGTAAGLLALFTVSCFWSPLQDVQTHLITAAKFAEYALLAPAVVLLLRRTVDLERFLIAFVAWAGAASLWGLLQFFGVVNEFDGKRPGQREVSFIGHESFGSFTGCALIVGFAALAVGGHRRLARAAIVAGAAGVVLDASISAYAGVVLGSLAVLWASRRLGRLDVRRVVAVALVLVTVGVGVEALRASDLGAYLAEIGIHTSSSPQKGVQSGSQRVLLVYIGLRIWEDHPWLGVGFERSADRYQPYLPAAKRRFPSQPPLAFPSSAHEWGVQNFWVQLLADMGLLGLAIGLATFGAGLLAAIRSLSANGFVALMALGWILVAAGTWTAIGIVAGIPLDALTFLGLGLAVVAGRIDSPVA